MLDVNYVPKMMNWTMVRRQCLGAPQKKPPILDNLRAHHSKPVKAWLAERTGRIEVHYLPSYAPELNPDERLNADMKHAIGAKVAVRTKPKLKAAAEEHMTMIGKPPDRVRAYFKDRRVKYAA